MKWKIKGVLTADRAGTIIMTPESTEDMWAVYNVLEAGDVVASSTFRKVVRESASGATSSDRVMMRLVVRVTGVNFDSEAGMIRVTGRNEAEAEHVKLGAFHTLELEPHRFFDVTKGTSASEARTAAPASCDESHRSASRFRPRCRVVGHAPLRGAQGRGGGWQPGGHHHRPHGRWHRIRAFVSVTSPALSRVRGPRAP